jgi:nuclear mRNA export protein SAC3
LSRPSPTTRPANGKSKENPQELDAKALAFLGRGSIVKECFGRWMQRAIDRAAWYEACRHSDAYSQKVKRQRLSGSPLADKKRRSGINGVDLPQKKRARKRVSSEYKPPRTDEDLARRFREVSYQYYHHWINVFFLSFWSIYIIESWREWTSLGARIVSSSYQNTCEEAHQ